MAEQQESNQKPNLQIGDYKVLDRLGGGYTAQVYSAEKDGQAVVLKVMREGLPPEIQSRFQEEADTIMELQRLEKEGEFEYEERRAWELLSLATEERSFFVDLKSYVAQDDACYFALEKLDISKNLAALVESGYSFSEKETVNIGWQMAHILDIFHQGLKRTYRDMKLDDFVWDGKKLKAYDFNVLGEKHFEETLPIEETQKDLATCGRYLYRLVTGVILNQDRGSHSEEELEIKGGEKWTALSLTTKDIIAKCLSGGYQKADDLRDDLINNGADLYTADYGFVFDALVEEMEPYWKSTTPISYDEARRLLGMVDLMKRKIAELKREVTGSKYAEGVEGFIEEKRGKSVLERMATLFAGGDWKELQEIAEKEKRYEGMARRYLSLSNRILTKEEREQIASLLPIKQADKLAEVLTALKLEDTDLYKEAVFLKVEEEVVENETDPLLSAIKGLDAFLTILGIEDKEYRQFCFNLYEAGKLKDKILISYKQFREDEGLLAIDRFNIDGISEKASSLVRSAFAFLQASDFSEVTTRLQSIRELKGEETFAYKTLNEFAKVQSDRFSWSKDSVFKEKIFFAIDLTRVGWEMGAAEVLKSIKTETLSSDWRECLSNLKTIFAEG